ncbi:MAG TPA: hydrolase [Clostridiales bacterium UBA8960]|nr:hydrolase [Clostridiales bacterium UBA8960]
MNPYMVTFLHHSGVLVETENHQLFFDVYFDDNFTMDDLESLIVEDKQAVFFVSHGHKDHYAPQIFAFSKFQNKKAPVYVISTDVEPIVPDTVYEILWVKPNQTYKMEHGDTLIRTFDSTDAGVAFLIEVDGVSIFHSGDLNWWHWKSATNEMQSQEENDFKQIMGQVVKAPIDLAFVPVDPRLEEAACFAMAYFAEHSDAKTLVPIHFGEAFETLKMRIDESTLKDDLRLIIPSHNIERFI